MKESFILNPQGSLKVRGVSLIESLVSLAVISFSLFFVVSAFPFVVKKTHQNEIENIAFFLATAKTEDIIEKGYQKIEEGVTVTDYGDVEFHDDYKIVTTITCFHPARECANENTGMKRVDVEVFGNKSLQRITNITSLITAR